MELASPSNPKIKYVVKLRNCSFREETGEMIVEGFRECRRALDNGYRPHAIFHCPDLYLKNENEPQLVADCVARGAEVFTCSKPAFLKMAYKDRPDGLLMVGPHVARRLADIDLPPHALVIVTESIEKPGNLGTILRSADAAHACAVIVCDRTTDIHNPNVVRASTGTLFSVPVIEASSDEAIAWLKARDFKILAATPHAEKLHFEVDLTGNVALAVGAEQYGLTAKWMDAADLRVRIPMLGLADSLGARRLGKAIADALRARGWNVIAASRTSPDPAFAVDLAEPDGPARLFAAVRAVAPDFCAVVNNAGLFSHDAELPPDAEARLRAVNVDAPRALTDLLAAHGGGAVVNILDCRVIGRDTCDTPYLRTKRDLLAATRADALRLAGRVRVNAVAPGPVLPPEHCHERAGATPLGRHPAPQEVADAVAYLLSAESTTGAVIPVDGGQSLLAKP